MKPIRLVHWNQSEGRRRTKALQEFGYAVDYDPVHAGVLLKILKENQPGALVVDLSRSPAQGRDLAVALRIHSSTRRTPLVFVGGSPEKVEGIKRLLPDAVFTTWEGGLDAAIRGAMESPPKHPVVPASTLAGYSGTPLPKKLGIMEGGRVLLVRSPPGFTGLLDPLPEGVRLLRRFGKNPGLILWFVRSVQELEAGIEKWRSRVSSDGIWIIWPKLSSERVSDLTATIVRRVGLDSGLVDYKIASIDETWSGLKFAIRR